MSYYSKIKKFLNLPGQQESDFYIKGTEQALKEYFSELNRKLSIAPIFMLNGTVAVGNFAYSIIDFPGGKMYTPKVYDISYLNIKSALWTDVPEEGFPNLFDEIGMNFVKSFILVTADPFVQGPPMPIMLNYSHFRHIGELFMAKIKTDATAQTLTPESFHETLSEYIEMAIKSIPPMPTAITGAWAAGGLFTGTVTVNFANVKL